MTSNSSQFNPQSVLLKIDILYLPLTEDGKEKNKTSLSFSIDIVDPSTLLPTSNLKGVNIGGLHVSP